MIKRFLFITAVFFIASTGNSQTKGQPSSGSGLPARYFQLLEAGIVRVEKRLNEEPEATLISLEKQPGWKHFPYTILIPALLYSKKHPANKHFGDEKMLQLTLRIGDFLVSEYDKGNYTSRGDNDWDTYMWLEAYRLIENKLGETRRSKWRAILEKEVQVPLPRLARSQDYPWYNAPFIGTSPNHYAIYASTLLVAGHVFNKPEWKKLATKVLHRFCTEEQAADGFWGEQSREGPTIGYDFLTLTQIALYWEYSKDPVALKALRRSTDFHKYYTYPDGTPVETMNDRNRYWGVSMWGHFGFSNFADGRRYAEFLTSFFPKGGDIKSYGGDLQSLGRVAQNVLYFHEGNVSPIPQDLQHYAHAMKVSAGIRKTGQWVVSYSGLIAPAFSNNNYFLDRQGNFSVFNKKCGLIISGANSKHQPQLATFTDLVDNRSLYMPISSRLQMSDTLDRLGLSYNSFFATLQVPKPLEKQLHFQFTTVHKWGDGVAELNLQLMLIPGDTLETGAGRKIVLSKDKIELSDQELGGWIKHNVWTLQIPEGMHLSWPVYPFNPYADAPETELEHAIGRLFLPFKAGNQVIPFILEVE